MDLVLASVDHREGVTPVVLDIALIHITNQFVHVATETLNLAVLFLGDIEGDGVDDTAVLWKARRDFFADK